MADGVMNPTQSQLEQSDVDIFLSGSRDAIVMVEGGAHMVPEDEILEALFAGHEAIQPFAANTRGNSPGDRQTEADMCRSPSWTTRLPHGSRIWRLPGCRQALRSPEKFERYKRIAEVKGEVVPAGFGGVSGQTKRYQRLPSRSSNVTFFAAWSFTKERRIDGRGLKDVRPIACEIRVLPRTHGSAFVYARRNPGTWWSPPWARRRTSKGSML